MTVGGMVVTYIKCIHWMQTLASKMTEILHCPMCVSRWISACGICTGSRNWHFRSAPSFLGLVLQIKSNKWSNKNMVHILFRSKVKAFILILQCEMLTNKHMKLKQYNISQANKQNPQNSWKVMKSRLFYN